jgi:hypothetical protein
MLIMKAEQSVVEKFTCEGRDLIFEEVVLTCRGHTKSLYIYKSLPEILVIAFGYDRWSYHDKATGTLCRKYFPSRHP